MSRLKRQIITLALSLGAVLAAKVYLNRKLELAAREPAAEETPAADVDPQAVTVETPGTPKAAEAPVESATGPIAKRP